MTENEFQKRVEEFVLPGTDYNDNDWDTIATEKRLDPFNKEDLRAYITAYRTQGPFASSLRDAEVEIGSPMYNFVHNVFFLTRIRMQDAACEWIYKKFGKEAEEEFEEICEENEKNLKDLSRSKNERDGWPESML